MTLATPDLMMAKEVKKVPVLKWLSRLATKDLGAQEMHDLLRSMLDTSSKRPLSGQIAYFQKLQLLHLL